MDAMTVRDLEKTVRSARAYFRYLQNLESHGPDGDSENAARIRENLAQRVLEYARYLDHLEMLVANVLGGVYLNNREIP